MPVYSSERYLVLGGRGFVGSHIVQALVERGDACVSVYARERPSKKDAIEGVVYYSGDIMEEEKLVECLKKVRLRVFWLGFCII
jgi:sterol-4alpha-carboxylate 3-dehydrogenase (decarboxylating)